MFRTADAPLPTRDRWLPDLANAGESNLGQGEDLLADVANTGHAAKVSINGYSRQVKKSACGLAGFSAARYSRNLMDVPRIIVGLLAATGWTQQVLAGHLRVPQNYVSRWQAGVEPRGKNRDALFDLAAEHGIIPREAAAGKAFVRVVAEVGAGASIDPEFEHSSPEQIEIVDLPYAIPDHMIGFRVVGLSMSPAFEPGEIIVVERDAPFSIERMIGLRAAVRVKHKNGDERRYLKRLAKGASAGLFNLESINDRSPPIENVEIRWASPVRLVIPQFGLGTRQPSKPGSKKR
jgi:repressor LexA